MSAQNANVLVRQTVQSDWPTCLSFERLDEYGRATEMDEQIIKSHIAMDATFIAEHGSNAVGYASLNFIYASRTPLLSWWYVNEAYRGSGVGSLLIAAVEKRLIGSGFHNYLISACREKEVSRHRAAGLDEIGTIQLAVNELERFFIKHIRLHSSSSQVL